MSEQQPTVPAQDATPATPANAAPAAPAAPDAQTPVEQQSHPGAAAESIDQLPAWAQKIIKDTRSEAANYRTKASSADQASQATLDRIASALGLKGEEKPDPEKLTAELGNAQEQARQRTVELAIYKAAGPNQANPDALLDSASFLAKVRTLDPKAGDFTNQVTDAIKEAVTANQSLKAVRAAGASGTEFSGGSGEQGQITEAQLAQMTPEQIVEAQEKGLLRNLLG
ncbi:hypothetical protein [Arthrobacter russicus]|uniref:3-oxoacyl-ACP reductase-like protein n=1 Tax=Arthrobacter russicus TaxID=172040 RepID=A0ABU1JBT5_9MICC|nr:hypothetical protein [Arthrobacter russicus]MDR6268911.1 3-oxoacyl-ACP reductase-like protein [Arthrobacter russicus]